MRSISFRFNDILLPNDFLILHNVIMDIIHLRIAAGERGGNGVAEENRLWGTRDADIDR